MVVSKTIEFLYLEQYHKVMALIDATLKKMELAAFRLFTAIDPLN